MAANVSSSVVTYRIGVQNRYSAFLDEDDNFALTNIDAPVPKQHSLDGKKKTVQKANAKANVKSSIGKHDGQTKSLQATNIQKNGTKIDTNRQQQQQQQNHKVALQQNGLTQQTKQLNSKQCIVEHDDNDLNGHNRQQRNAYLANSNQSQTNGYMNKENKSEPNNPASESNGKSNFRAPRDGRFSNRPRQYYREDEKQAQTVQDNDRTGSSSVEKERKRRLQKRVNDLRHKDTEKRDARRQQASKDCEAQESQRLDGNSNQLDKPDEQSNKPRGNPRLPRREGERFDGVPRGFKAGARGRGGRRDDEEVSNNDPGKQDAHDRRRYDGERANRARGGFIKGNESRGGNRNDEMSRNLDRQKPIPNFSDRSDFPSLAS